MSVAYKLPGYVRFDEPALRFAGGEQSVDIHPLLGLARFGPFSQNRLSGVSNPIRIAMIAPTGGLDRLAQLMREIDQPQKPRERKKYLPDFPGFSKLFGVQLARA